LIAAINPGQNPLELLSAASEYIVNKEECKGFADRAFRDFYTDSPLLQLQLHDRVYLVSLLKVFEVATTSKNVPPFSASLEGAHQIADQARTLASGMKANEGLRNLERLDPFLHLRFASIADDLDAFASFVTTVLGALGKVGHKHHAFPNTLIVAASEFVRLHTGSYNDEHLVELFQRFRVDATEKFSGDAIRKRREQMKRYYPKLYDEALRIANR
jgi:hypothetical protein